MSDPVHSELHRLKQIEGLPPFSDFIDVRSATQPFTSAAGFGGTRRKSRASSNSVTTGCQFFSCPLIVGFSAPLTLIGELIPLPLVTGRAEDGCLPEFGSAPGRSDQDDSRVGTLMATSPFRPIRIAPSPHLCSGWSRYANYNCFCLLGAESPFRESAYVEFGCRLHTRGL
jgi:hypothetical protein